VGIYKDVAISGASITLRPGIQQLLHDAESARFDIILAEALDRVAATRRTSRRSTSTSSSQA
jgi:DNA invertase Pin-like site-specific DNA recombinase